MTEAPTTRFTRENFTYDKESGELVACASDLGWRAGVWPESLGIDGVLYRRGQSRIDRREGELLSVSYEPTNSAFLSLTLFND